MKTIKNLFNYFTKNNENKPKSKKDANLKYNSTLYFQFSLILSITLVAIVINATYGVKNMTVAHPILDDPIEIWIHDIVIVEPKTEPVIEEKPIKKVNPEKILITEKKVLKGIEIETDPKPEIIPIKTPIVVKPKPETVDDKTYSFAGVERVPVFPGCESLTDNEQRKECMSSQIGNLVSKRFNTGLAENLGLKGNQRIYVSFVVNKEGQIDKIQVRAPHPKLEKEARRVVNLIPKMLPASQNNKNVEVLFSLPIIFSVQQ